MSVDQNNYKFYRSFRLKTSPKDKIFVTIKKIIVDKAESFTNTKCRVLDFNAQGISFSSDIKVPINSTIEFNFKCEKFLSKFEKKLRGKIIRTFVSDKSSKEFNYAIKLENQDSDLTSFTAKFIDKFNKERLSHYFQDSCFNSRNADLSEAKEVFSLITSLFKNFLDNEDAKISKNEVDFDKFRKGLNLQAIGLMLLGPEDKFVDKVISRESTEIYENFDLHESRTNSFATNKIVSCKLVNEKDSIHYLCTPVLNKFNKPIGVLEFIRDGFENCFNFEDEKIIQLLSYILSNQLHNHRPVLPGSKYEHLNPRMEKEAFLYGISKGREQIHEIVATALLTNCSLLLVGDKSDREFVANYLKNKSEKSDSFETLDIHKLENIKLNENKTYCIDLSSANALELGTLKHLYKQESKAKFILHTDYHHWMANSTLFYSMGTLCAKIPAIIMRKDDYQEIAENICRLNQSKLESTVKELILNRVPLKSAMSFQHFKEFILQTPVESSKIGFDKKTVSEATFEVHCPSFTLDEYSTFISTQIDEVTSNFTIENQIENIKKAA